MASIVISQQDVDLADVFLSAYLADKVPEGDFSEGSALRDFAVKAIAYVFAFLERERKISRDRQSLLSLAALPAGESVDDALDALLSNWFLDRKTGANAVMPVVLHFSQAVDVEILSNTRFFKTTSVVFSLNSASTTVIPASDLRPNVNADGTITDYSVTINMTAVASGTAGNADPGRFASADPFNSFFLYAENLEKGNGGRDVETAAELLTRAPTAISVRNLINARSIDTVLRDTFDISELLTVGMNDPEMIRDLSTEAVTGLRMHVGGYNDIYVLMPRYSKTELLTIGALFARPDNLANILRDTTQDFIAAGVVVGDILRLNSGLPNTPREYIITAVTTTTLEVQPRMAFSRPTDETSEFVAYTVGNLAPSFDNILGNGTPLTTGQTSRRIQEAGHVLLSGGPQLKVTSVEVIELDTSVTVLDERVNTAPGAGQYQLITRVPGDAQSAFATTDVVVPLEHDGKQVRIRYDTLVGWEAVHAYVRDRFERVVIANPLVKSYNPVYISMNIRYRLKATATAVVDNTVLAESIATFINAFSTAETIELTAITEHIRATFTNIGALLDPISLTYELFAPDGQVYAYQTQDLVTIYPDADSNAAQLTNGSVLRDPLPDASLPITTGNQALIDAANVTLGEQLALIGVSDRTVRYIALATDINVAQVV